MKYRYKNLIPIVLVILMAAAWYKLIDTTVNTQKQYDGYLTAARQYAKDGVIIDAITNYDNAINIKDDISVRKEVADLYFNNNRTDEGFDYVETVLSTYPKNVSAYEYAITKYKESNMYSQCFSVYSKAKNYGAVNQTIDKLMEDIQYSYKVLLTSVSEVSMYSNDMCAVRIGDYWGFVSVAGELLTDVKYAEVGDFVSDKVYVKEEDGTAYFMDSAANKRGVLPDNVAVQKVGNVQSDCYPLVSGNGCDYYNLNKTKVLGTYADATPFYNGYAVATTEKGCGLIDTKGNNIGNDNYIKTAVDERGIATVNERVFFMEGDHWLMTSLEGEKIGQDTFEEVKPFYSDNSYAAVKKDGKWGFVDKEGKVIISPQYEEARSFSYGYAAVKKDGKWGFIDTSGKICIEPQFQDAMDMNSKGNIFVKENDVWQLISLYRYNY